MTWTGKLNSCSKLIVALFLALSVSINISCEKENPGAFSEEVLESILIDKNGNEVSFREALDKHQEREIVIYFWASWCKDCLVGFPELKKLQAKNKETVFINISLDRSIESWAVALEKYKLRGDHYYNVDGLEGELSDFVDLDWIPRYIVLNSEGEIQQFDINESEKLILH